jgi:branched-chain amino acid transport system ATP-binding protein
VSRAPGTAAASARSDGPAEEPRSGGAAAPALLEVDGVEVVYHRAATAVQGVTLRVDASQIVALIGPNGAGKTTTLRAISGFLDADDARITAGRIHFDGISIGGWLPHRVARRGLVVVPEREKVFESLTVLENLEASRRVAPAGRRTVALHEVFAYFPSLADRRRQLAGLLSGGERQMLAVGAALLCQPRLLLVDELSLGLAPLAVEALMEMLSRLRAELQLAILLVEQNVAAALAIADHGYVLEQGRIVHQGPAAQLAGHADIREFYLGRGRAVDTAPGDARRRSYREVKQYRRRRRWFG